jgi:glycosyltransferase involved in cell wall biosynthesis
MTADSLPGHAQRSQPPHRIAFCITDLDVGGAEQCLVNIVCGLDRQQWEPHVYCLGQRGALVDRLEQSGIPCTCLDWRGWPDAWRMLSLARRLRRFQPQLLQTFLFHGNLAGRIAGTLAGVPIIVSGIRVAEKEKHWHLRLERLTRRLVACHVCVSEAVADFSIREARLPPERVVVIPNGVNVDRFASATAVPNEELNAPPQTRWMISVGRLHPQKGHRLLIEAVGPLLRERPDWRLMIVGDGPLRAELDQQINQSGCHEQIVLLGFRRDVPRLLKSASLFVLPSLWEGQPNAILEAMAAGLPVVATDVEGVRGGGQIPSAGSPPTNPGAVQPGVTGIVVPPADVAALRAAIEVLLDAPERLGLLSSQTLLSVNSILTTHQMTARYARLYAALLESRGF